MARFVPGMNSHYSRELHGAILTILVIALALAGLTFESWYPWYPGLPH